MMKTYTLFAISMLVFGFSINASADLYNRGTDSLGNRLIYDSDLDVTWYDFTSTYDTWQNQMNWASDLSISFEGRVYSDWRLPHTADGPFSWGNDGTTTAGYNITNNELGHLFYTSLKNQGAKNKIGFPTGCGTSCLTSTGPFVNLQPYSYWFGTDYGDDPSLAWYMVFTSGSKSYGDKGFSVGAIAVRSGDIPIIPEPISTILFVAGGTLLFGRRFIKRKKTA